jgi:toxin ParE1/3/4
MSFQVAILAEAEDDLLDIYRYILLNDSAASANLVWDGIESVCRELCNLPERGHVPPELEWIGVTSYREIHFKPYRIIYEIDGRKVFVHCVLDGRRDLRDLLERRLLR